MTHPHHLLLCTLISFELALLPLTVRSNCSSFVSDSWQHLCHTLIPSSQRQVQPVFVQSMEASLLPPCPELQFSLLTSHLKCCSNFLTGLPRPTVGPSLRTPNCNQRAFWGGSGEKGYLSISQPPSLSTASDCIRIVSSFLCVCRTLLPSSQTCSHTAHLSVPEILCALLRGGLSTSYCLCLEASAHLTCAQLPLWISAQAHPRKPSLTLLPRSDSPVHALIAGSM